MIKNAGFTLVELLVVIGILGLLSVAILGGLSKGQQAANIFICERHLMSLHEAVQIVKTRDKTYPKGEGLDFLYNVWLWGLEKNDKGRDTMFCPAIESSEELDELRKLQADEIWQTRDEFTSDSTNFAALTRAAKKRISSGRTILFADDNEGGNNHADGSINVIYGDGSTKIFTRQFLVGEGILEGTGGEDEEDEHVRIGPDSQLPQLTKLKYN